MVEQPALSFAGLLRQLRVEARLTQEELAEAAGLSPRSVSDLERGINRTARKDTALLLAGALGLAGPVAELFIAAARGRGQPEDVRAARTIAAPGAFLATATRALPRDIASFTGRRAELDQLVEGRDSLAARGGVVGICAIGGMAGIGKTTFAVHAAHRLAESFPDGQFFLPLHAHTLGQRPVDPADALSSLLLTAGVPAAQIPPGLGARAARWRDHVAGKKILLVLDDAAGHVQVRPLLPGTAGSLVLITSRRRLTALEDAAVITLETLPPAEAATLLVRLAARPDLRAADAAVGEIARLCGYLPLAIGLLASKLGHHPAWSADYLAAELAEARHRLAAMHAEDLSVAAAFDLSYAKLTPAQQSLFSRLGLVPGPSFDAFVVTALDGTSLDIARRRLDELYDQHLIAELAPGRYRLHDLLREHARILAAGGDPGERDAATGRLLDYYLHTALTAGQHFPSWTATRGQPPSPRPPACVPQLATLRQAAAWLETERPNLHAAADAATAAGRPLYGVHLAAAIGDFLRAHGPWDQAAALYQTALTAAQMAGDWSAQAFAFRQLGVVGWLSGDYAAAADSLAQAVALYREAGDRASEAYALDHLGVVQQHTGDYPAAAASRSQALALARTCGDPLAEALALNHLGLLQMGIGDYAAAATSLRQSLALFRSLGHRLGEADVLNNLGILHQETGNYPASAASLGEALRLFRALGHRLFEADTLNNLGMVQQLTGDYRAATANHQQALQVFSALGHRHGEAKALNSLGELSSRMAATGQARGHHTKALAIARDIGVPLQEARALEGLGRSHLRDGNRGKAAGDLRQSLAIYQRLGAPATRRVQETLTSMDQHQSHQNQGQQPSQAAGPGA